MIVLSRTSYPLWFTFRPRGLLLHVGHPELFNRRFLMIFTIREIQNALSSYNTGLCAPNFLIL